MSVTRSRRQLEPNKPDVIQAMTEPVRTALTDLASILVDTKKKISITWELWVGANGEVRIEVYVHADGQVTRFEDAEKQHRDIELLLHKIMQ